MEINIALAQHLVAEQFPQWAALRIIPVATSGWDNRTFHLGDSMLIRMPSGTDYALQVEKEQRWLPILAAQLPLPIPAPVAIGKPGEGYPWHWSINQWIEGETASTTNISDLTQFSIDLAKFLVALQDVDTTGGPSPGLHSFFRGGALSTYDAETRQAITMLHDKLDANAATTIWERALESSWQKPPVWVHGDIALGNLLVKHDRLCAVIDFGQLVVGDPACDLAIAWTFFKNESREAFRSILKLDHDTWCRGQGWTLWKALITAVKLTGGNAIETKSVWRIIEEVIGDDAGLYF